MMTQELIISEAAGARYMRAWESFVEALRGGEHISFSAFCRNAHVNSTGFRRWLYVQRLSVRDLKKSITLENKILQQTSTSTEKSASISPNLFVPIVPSQVNLEDCRSLDSFICKQENLLHDIKLDFANNLSVSLKECTLNDLIVLITQCSKQGGM